jgi:hypothetical protein
VEPEPQALPHAPQFALSVFSSTHTEGVPQPVVPLGHWQAPSMHSPPPVHAGVQALWHTPLAQTWPAVQA